MTSQELIVTKPKCTGCEACSQICTRRAISMTEDAEGFRYPNINENLCIECGLCKKVCPIENMPRRYNNKTVYGGYIKDDNVREKSTSGGVFSAIVESCCDSNYVIFGAETKGLEVYHGYTFDKNELNRFRKSKYTQSHIGTCYEDAKLFLKEGKQVVFSGTPCQIAGLRSYLKNTDVSKLLTIDVICEGLPTPHFIRRYCEHVMNKHGASVESIDYRYKDSDRWDFEVMLTNTISKSHIQRTFKRDRWFNPFWSIWLQHLMSRPSCYECQFANISRVADITLGDLWGVHKYCPELYGGNRGTSLILCNTEKGKMALQKCKQMLYGHELTLDDALKYQSPLRGSIAMNPQRDEFMHDVISMKYDFIIRKWAKRASLNLLFQKYVLGKNSQKVWWYNFKKKLGL